MNDFYRMSDLAAKACVILQSSVVVIKCGSIYPPGLLTRADNWHEFILEREETNDNKKDASA